ncbi:alpha/beta-hydrolase [Artomyces pyxidatus]|uniref:Alpha/beta-hydrolase n=1 Tax=Artomyces pyxidatus TaxID=48021 RepID=A0ACB8TE79_9AGAM|nr:alpha/beta-hydrolase [Artomyces pyxidatus]
MTSSNDRILAGTPGECCIKTVHHTGEPVGTTEVIGAVNTYVSYPPVRKERYEQILLFFADVYGYLVVGIDYFEGDPIQANKDKPGFNLTAWVDGKRERANPLVPKWIEEVKAKYGTPTTKYAAVGYCFGGPDVLECGATDWLAAGAIAHPAFLTEAHFRNLKQPLFLSCAEVDHTFERPARHRAEEILVEQKAEYHFQVFSGISHGFGCRGNPEVPRERWAKEQSVNSILGWFDRFCK